MPMFKQLIEIVMPQSCAGCGAAQVSLCARCALVLKSPAHRVRVRGIGPDEFPIFASARYEGPARNILIAAKERNQVSLIPAIAMATLNATISLLAKSDSTTKVLLVPVPSRPRNLHLRGYNLVTQMTERIAKHLRMRIDDVRVTPLLRHSRNVADQSLLTAKQRVRNLQGAFATIDDFLPHLVDREVVIVDDLVTTGSTLLEARRSLLAVGAHLRGAVCSMSSY